MEFDSETLFNAAAAAVSTIAVVTFIVDHGFPYSPVSKVALVVAFLAGVFAVTQTTADDQLTVLGYAVIVVSTVALVFDTLGTFNVATMGRVLALLGVAVVLFGLRTAVSETSRFVSGQRAKQAFAVLVVLAVAVLTVDVVAAGLSYELKTQQEIQVSGSGEPEVGAKLGEVVVTNSGPFPRRIDMPNYGVCAAGNWSAYQPEHDGESRPVDAHLRIERRYGDHVFGFSQRAYDAVVRLEATNIDGERFLVRQTERCPDDESGDPYLAVFERSEEGPYGYAD
ncbi:MAG: hypothetical protein ABEH90_05055 [Halolamina sp.]